MLLSDKDEPVTPKTKRHVLSRSAATGLWRAAAQSIALPSKCYAARQATDYGGLGHLLGWSLSAKHPTSPDMMASLPLRTLEVYKVMF
jgi:hypothetical protein